LSSCNSSPREFPEGNIDVDSEIYIVPVGDVDEKYLYALIPKLEKRFTTKVHLALDKRLPNPDHAYDFEAKQYVDMYVLRDLVDLDVPENVKVLGVANVDLFSPESDRSIVFGQAHFSRNSKAALISMLRMNPSSYVRGKPDDELLVRRMTIEAIHELGHALEGKDPEVARKAREFYDRRTEGYPVEPLKKYNDSYDPHEMTKRNKFEDPYMGKIYKHGATEIVSMGLEKMWEDPARFAKKDPDYFDFMYNLLRGR